MSTARGRGGDRPARTPRPPVAPAARRELVLPLPLPWARERIAAARQLGEVPEYGSPAWVALDDEDPRKMAAALILAEVQRFEDATLAERLAAEIAEARYVAECAEVEDAIVAGARAAQVVEEKVRQLGTPRPSFAQLQAERYGADSDPARAAFAAAQRIASEAARTSLPIFHRPRRPRRSA